MNRRELVRAVAAHTEKDPKEIDQVLAGTTDVITAVVAKGDAVMIQGFAKFAVASRAARMGRNPRTGEQIRIKASKRMRITPMKALKEQAVAPAKAPRLGRGVYPTDPELLARQAQDRKAGAATPAASTRAAGATKVAKKATVKKATVKKAAVRKAAAPAKKAAGRPTAKATTKRAPAVRKTTAKRAPVKKTTAKRAPAKKAVAKRGAARR